jgi:hypothetical protein
VITMPKFRITYTKHELYECDVEAQNEGQVRHLFDADMIDFDNERHINTQSGKLNTVEKVGRK